MTPASRCAKPTGSFFDSGSLFLPLVRRTAYADTAPILSQQSFGSGSAINKPTFTTPWRTRLCAA